MEGPHSIEAQIARGDFWVMMKEAVAAAGGIPEMVVDGLDRKSVEELRSLDIVGASRLPYADMRLKEVVDILAQNGIRMVYMPEKKISFSDELKEAA